MTRMVAFEAEVDGQAYELGYDLDDVAEISIPTTPANPEDRLILTFKPGKRPLWAPKAATSPIAPAVGDRVQVKPEHDETLRLLAMRTTPGTVTAIHEDGAAIVVDLDSGQGVPYRPEELDILEEHIR